LKDDPYWDPDEVTEESLLNIGLDVSETKYLSLTLSENIYRKYILSRYMMSTIDYLQDKLVTTIEGGETILYNTKLEAGELFGTSATEISIYSYFEAIKVIYKAILKLYEHDGNIDSSFTDETNESGVKYYGINTNNSEDGWPSELADIFLQYIDNYANIKNEFLTAYKTTNLDNPEPLSFDRFNIYKETSDWINYDNRTEGNLGIFYKKYDYTQKTEVAKQLETKIFSTHKTTYGKDNVDNNYQNSGPYILETFDNLNLLRIDTNEDLWLHILGQY
jgi:hypothetical protein